MSDVEARRRAAEQIAADIWERVRVRLFIADRARAYRIRTRCKRCWNPVRQDSPTGLCWQHQEAAGDEARIEDAPRPI